MKKFLLLVISAFVLSACSTVNTVERADSQATPKMVNDKRIVTDYALNDYAYIASVNEAIVSGNLLKIQAKIVNSTTARRGVNYRFDWFDKDGMQVNSASSSWNSIVLEGGEAKYISAVATNPKVVDFSLKLLPMR